MGVGIHVLHGCEVMIDRTWLAELPAETMQPTATGILIDGNDHDVTNVVVWSALINMHIKSGGDTMVTGVHNWYVATPPSVHSEAIENKSLCYGHSFLILCELPLRETWRFALHVMHTRSCTAIS